MFCHWKNSVPLKGQELSVIFQGSCEREPDLPGMQLLPPTHKRLSSASSTHQTWNSLKRRLKRKLGEVSLEFNDITLKCHDIKFRSDKKLLITCKSELRKSKELTQCIWLPESFSGDFDLSFAAVTNQSEGKAQERKISNFHIDPVSAIQPLGTELQEVACKIWSTVCKSASSMVPRSPKIILFWRRDTIFKARAYQQPPAGWLQHKRKDQCMAGLVPRALL